MSLRLLNFIPQTTLAICMAVFAACGKPEMEPEVTAERGGRSFGGAACRGKPTGNCRASRAGGTFAIR
jgi:hypothetical protein